MKHFAIFLLALTITNNVIDHCHGFAALSSPPSMWQILTANSNLNTNTTTTFQTIFGIDGQRGEYMDGYSQAAMMERCRDDYKWDIEHSETSKERVKMMSHLYDNKMLYEYVNMVAFAEHYLHDDNKAYQTFVKYKKLQPLNQPIFAGVVWDNWQQDLQQDDLHLPKMDYVRMHCNLEVAPDNDNTYSLYRRLAVAAKKCQIYEMVPVMLIQVPWRVKNASKYFSEAMNTLAKELEIAGVDSNKMILETRPPIGISAQEEEGMVGSMRIELGFQTGQLMFRSIQEAFKGNTIAGFCVAGGSTKGDFPTAMQDDTQNAVRQGIRSCASDTWGYDFCFWEMGAKLMLQPQVGKLYGHNGQAGQDAARELFCVNARDMADEIQEALS